jgi:hypothetical protein
VIPCSVLYVHAVCQLQNVESAVEFKGRQTVRKGLLLGGLGLGIVTGGAA